MEENLVLVTGGSGFVGGHAIARLRQDGYRVRTTVRKPREMPAGVEVVVADLTADAGWAEAVAGCRYVLHVASPFSLAAPADDDEVIVPARDGTLRVLRAARAAGVERVVLTSSFAAVGYGPQQSSPAARFDETNWTDPTAAGLSAYVRSKAIAERAAWDFAADGGLELAVVNPVGIFGPVLGPDLSGSVQLIRRLLDGAMPGVPRLTTNVVDVRDVADLHVRAMTAPEAAGERFLALAGDPIGFPEIARLLRTRLGAAGARVPTRVLPDAVVRPGAQGNPMAPEVEVVRWASNEKARKVLGWTPRTNEEAILATAESL